MITSGERLRNLNLLSTPSNAGELYMVDGGDFRVNKTGVFSWLDTQKQVIFIGDSISAPSTNALGDLSWPRQFIKNYQPLSNAEVVELAVAGTTAQQASTGLAWTGYSPPNGGGLVFVEFSTNDFAAGRTPSQILGDLQTIASGWQSRGYEVCLLTPARYPADQASTLTLQSGILAATWPDYVADITTDSFDINDYVHPSAKGSLTLANNVAKSMAGQKTQDISVTLPVSVIKAITGVATGNPAVVTATAHGLTTGNLIEITGSTGSTPTINGIHEVTVTGPDTFTIPVNVTVSGTGGQLNSGVCLFEGNRQFYERTTWIIHANQDLTYGDMETYIASALTGYSQDVFGLTPIAGAFVFLPSPIIRGVAKRGVSTIDLYLVNSGVYFPLRITAREIFAS